MPKYKSERRQMQAANTRADILRAARKLFAEKSYAGTSVEDIAREAGVAVQTIYSSVGSKRGVLSGLNDLIDEEAGLDERVGRVFSMEDPYEILALTVNITRQFSEVCGDILGAIISAAPSEPEMKEILDEGKRRHRGGMRQIADHIGKALRPGVGSERAAQTMSLLTWTESWFVLTREYGMTFDEAEEWLTVTLGLLLLPERPASRKPQA